MFSSSNSPQVSLCKKKILHHIKIPAHVWSTKYVDEIKKYLHSFVVLCETNILSLINQCLDNYYKIKTKLLQCQTVIRAPQFGDLNKALSRLGLEFVVIQVSKPKPYI
jgi:hypothetical protein